MSEYFIHDHPGRSVRLSCEPPVDPLDPLALGAFAVRALETLAGELFLPLAADLAVRFVDDIGLAVAQPVPPRPFWLLRAAHLPAQVIVHEFWEGQRVEETEVLSAQSLRRWLESALAANAPAPPGLRAAWEELMVRATCARLPRACAAAPAVALRQDGGTVQFPVLQGQAACVAGPAGDTPAPMTVRLTCAAGRLTFDLALAWSIWTEPGSEGEAMVEAALQRLLREGWSRESE